MADDRSKNTANMGTAPPPTIFSSLPENITPAPTYAQDAFGPPTQQAQQPSGKPTSKLKSVLSNFFTNFAQNAGMNPEQRLQQDEFKARLPLLKAQVDALNQQNELVDLPPMVAKDLGVEARVRRQDAPRLYETWFRAKAAADQAAFIQSQLNQRQQAGFQQQNVQREDTQSFTAGENEKNRQAALDRAKLVAQRANQGVFIPTTDARGNITGFYNNKNPGIVVPPTVEGMRRSGLPAEEFATQAGAGTISTQIQHMKDLASKRPDALGPAAGRIGALTTEIIGGDPEAADLYQTIDDVSNKLVYLFSGKQINEQEFKRLKKALPGKELPPDTFAVRLKNFETTFNDVMQRRRAGNPNGGSNAPPPGAKVRDFSTLFPK